MRTEVGLREGDTKGGIGRKVKLGVALSPVFNHSNVDGSSGAGTVDVGHFEQI